MPRATYTPDQIEQFYDRIALPTKWRLEPGEESKAVANSPEGYDYLAVLQRYTLCHIPFENLELHYSRTKTIDLHPDLLFKKIISQGTGRGGYCMENNTFFAAVLRSLGFELMSTGGRVNSSAAPNGDIGSQHSFWFGLGHMVNVVTVQGIRYLVDVGFGAGSSTRPLPLEENTEHLNIAPSQSVRLRYDSIDDHESSSAKVWIFERRNATDQPWSPMYCFLHNVEFLPADFMALNHFTSTSRMVFLTFMALVVRHVLSEDGEEVVGEDVLLEGRYHRRIRGRLVEEKDLESEGNRVQLLEERFGIVLDEHQQSGILGMSSMLSP